MRPRQLIVSSLPLVQVQRLRYPYFRCWGRIVQHSVLLLELNIEQAVILGKCLMGWHGGVTTLARREVVKPDGWLNGSVG